MRGVYKNGVTFYKLHASGNDFILLDATSPQSLPAKISYREFARHHCRRKYNVGADGLLVIEPSRRADYKMRIFNSDGSEAQMCGNGARCAGLWASQIKKPRTAGRGMTFETRAGVIESQLVSLRSQLQGGRNCFQVRIKMFDPFNLKLVMPIKVLGRDMKVNFINTGVPHAVVFVQDLDGIDIERIGRAIHRHAQFQPQGTNVDFVEVRKNDLIKVRTYERGVEAETLACGTGVVASAIIAWFMTHGSWKKGKKTVRVKVRSNEILKVYFSVAREKIENVWLEGKAYFIYSGKLV